MSGTPEFDFRACVLVSGLVTAAEVDLARDELRAVVPFADQLPATELNRQWAQRLVDAGKINAWQATQLLVGRAKFHLGPYRMLDAIGQGGMGQVFRAVHTVMGRTVAVKVLPRHKTTPETVAAFDREIRAQALLDHPNLVRAYDAGHDGNVHYLVTEYVPGTDLRRLMRQASRLSMSQAASIVSQAAQGLASAHSLGLIHRDVKPGNVLVRDDGVVKLSDLGLVEFSSDNDEGYSPGGKIVGTADYLAPEQITAPQTLSPASDIYALGCTLYYAVTGKVPFPGGTVKDKARAHVRLQPLDPRRLNPDLSAEFVEVIWAMMVKDPQQRIAQALAVVERLAPWTSNPAPIVVPPRPIAPPRSAQSPVPAAMKDTDPGAVLAADVPPAAPVLAAMAPPPAPPTVPAGSQAPLVPRPAPSSHTPGQPQAPAPSKTPTQPRTPLPSKAPPPQVAANVSAPPGGRPAGSVTGQPPAPPSPPRPVPNKTPAAPVASPPPATKTPAAPVGTPLAPTTGPTAPRAPVSPSASPAPALAAQAIRTPTTPPLPRPSGSATVVAAAPPAAPVAIPMQATHPLADATEETLPDFQPGPIFHPRARRSAWPAWALPALIALGLLALAGLAWVMQ